MDEPCVLLIAGSWGQGPLVQISELLAGAGIHTLAVAGRNARAEAALRAAAWSHSRLVPFGFTDRIPTLMAAADAVITTSGDTCSEARVVGRHLLLVDAVPGHGRENLQHELERGSADVLPGDLLALRRAVLACLSTLTRPADRVTQTGTAWERALDVALSRVGLAGLGIAPASR